MMENLQPTEEVNSNSQRMDNAAKYPDVLKLFSGLLTNSEDIKFKRKAGKSKLQETFEGSTFEPSGVEHRGNSILAYISYWVAVFKLADKELFSITPAKFDKALIKMIKPVASEVREILSKRECTNWLAFSELLPMIKYSGNVLKREYLSFFSEIRDKIKELVRIKVGNRQTKKSIEMMKVKKKFEELLKTEEIDENNVRTLIEHWVNKFVTFQFTDRDEFVDNLMLLIPYTYLICLKTMPFAKWEWEQFLDQFDQMDKMDTDQLLKAWEYDQTSDSSSLFTTLMLEQPKMFVNDYLDRIDDSMMHIFIDDYCNILVRITSDKIITLSYRAIFNILIEVVEVCGVPENPGLVVYFGKKEKTTIYKYISRWMERRKNTSVLSESIFIMWLLDHLESINSKFWDDLMNDNNCRLTKYINLLNDRLDGGKYRLGSTDAKDPNPDAFEDFVSWWKKRLVPDFVPKVTDLEDLQCFLPTWYRNKVKKN